MKKHLHELLKRKEDQRRSKPILAPLEGSFLTARPSNFPKNSIGYFADQIVMPLDLLLKQFAAAGISELTPEHKLRSQDKDALLQYFRKIHSQPILASSIYEHNEISQLDIQSVSEVSMQLIAYLAKNPETMYSMSPRKFEHLVAFLLEKHGCEVTLTKATRDGGYDIWAKMRTPISDFLILAECKRYDRQNRVGVEVIRGLYGVTEAHKANQGLIVTSSFFTKDAKEEQIRIGNRISLSDYNHLTNWLSRHAHEN